MARECKWGQSPFASKRGQTCRRARSCESSQRRYAIRATIRRDASSAASQLRLMRMPRPPRSYLCRPVLSRAQSRESQAPRSFTRPPTTRRSCSSWRRAQEHLELPILAACLMPNHVHLVVRPHRQMTTLPAGCNGCSPRTRATTTRNTAQSGTSGRAASKHFLVQDDHYLLTLMRYVERNALRANLVTRAEDWRWGSLHWRMRTRSPLTLAAPPTRTAAVVGGVRQSATDRGRTRGHSHQRQSPATFWRSRLGQEQGPRSGP